MVISPKDAGRRGGGQRRGGNATLSPLDKAREEKKIVREKRKWSAKATEGSLFWT